MNSLSGELTNTSTLLERHRQGDLSAREQLIERYLPRLQKWAHGRLPSYGRELSETDDLVQITFLRALKQLDHFESQRPGAFLAYLRTILINSVREELRRRKRRPNTSPLLVSMPAEGASPVEQAVGEETLEAYEAALSKLPEEKRLAVMMKVEFDLSYEEIALELNLSSANATRMMITRALAAMATELGR